MSQICAEFILKKRSNRFAQDIAQMVSGRNTSGRRRVFGSSCKEGGVSEIKRKNPNNSNIQKETANILNLDKQK